ncbi:unnamed protein product [Lactuca virosa]|uniref:FAR1 domain-containing protein n=1 Tax=Lactuca virosa TaxID=75947 RepID=A0AAU9PUH5_9ASTR|nr:unnamed protein product [Lactuca virosa]
MFDSEQTSIQSDGVQCLQVVEKDMFDSEQTSIQSDRVQCLQVVEKDMCESEPTSFHSDGVQCVQVEKTWTPKTELKPFVGQLFRLYDDALSFYREYARKSRFEIRKGTTEQSKTGDGYSRRHFEEKHTHELVNPEDFHFLKSNRRLTYHQKQLIHDVSNINIGPVRAFKILKQTQGGFLNVGATEVECKNLKRDWIKYIGENDADMVIDKLKKRTFTRLFF